MKRLPITAKAKIGNTKSPLKFDYRFTKGMADQVAASREFIAAGDAMGLGIDSSERRIQRQNEISGNKKTDDGPDMRGFNRAVEEFPVGNTPYTQQKEPKKSKSQAPKDSSSKKGYRMDITGGKKLAMGSKGVEVI
jgi:hypothetical protein